MDTLIHSITINNLKSKTNVQLWQFSISKGNQENYEKEKHEIECGESAIWTKPTAYNNYKDKLNILLVTDQTYTDIYEFKHSDMDYRDHWIIDEDKKYGVIDLKIIGRLNFGSSIMSGFCRYPRWSIANRFQPIKRVTLEELIQNIESWRVLFKDN